MGPGCNGLLGFAEENQMSSGVHFNLILEVLVSQGLTGGELITSANYHEVVVVPMDTCILHSSCILHSFATWSKWLSW